MSESLPQLSLGAATFGLKSSNRAETFVRLQGKDEVQPLMDLFKSFGYKEVDTARIYTDSEAALGELDKSSLADLRISTKVHPFITPLTIENILQQFDESLAALGVENVDLLYLHHPDDKTPIEESLEGVDILYKQGKIRRFGLSNHSPSQVDEIVSICKSKGYIAPTMYQGLYSPIARTGYLEIRDLLKKHGIHYYAYGIMAAGLLTGKNKFDEEPKEDARLHSTSFLSGHLRERYWHREVFAALDLLAKAAEKEGIPFAQATNRWMRHHSGLTKEDGILVGASSFKQLEQNLLDLEMGPLSPTLVDAYENAWKSVEHRRIAAPGSSDKVK
ncbi:hypothetical protein BGW38_000415 [Lunasporangiospora selenospora]|uniref:NADP-dependent oxidoreductase domain-containing protein n=1 Tax=Lunasporangiospora selenospora TaxID=979761 RepID=A0A9P6G2E6_9FUNG|nr:hypothetical protein BGW38_000415 [Lunasporangiospora selenospora]